MSDPLLATKMNIPRERSNLVSRQRLLHRLDDGLGCKLTVLSAPAGFGKTTLLSDWVNSLDPDVKVAWLTLDEGDNDVMRLIAYLAATLQKVEPGLGKSATALMQSLQPQVEAVLADLINEIAEYPPPLVLVLDDYHLIEAQAVHAALTFLLDHQPSQLHLFIATRADPPLHLALLRGRGQLNELRLADLRFTTEESAAFLNQVLKLDLNPGDIAALAARTEGWIAGLQLAGVSLYGREDPSGFVKSFTGSNRFILDYLSEEVLLHQSAPVQDFLLRTSILERLNGSLCDYVWNPSMPKSERVDQFTGGHLPPNLPEPTQAHLPAAEILDYLERSNLFLLPLDDRLEWYRYHQLFADLLQGRLLKTYPGLIPILHQRASQWFEKYGLLSEAIEHACGASDYERAARLIEQVAEATLMRSEVTTLLRWLDLLPEANIRAHPSLVAYHAWVLLISGRPLEAVLARLEHLGPEDEPLSAKAIPLRAFLAINRGEPSLALDLSRQALESLDDSDAYLRSVAFVTQASSLLAEGDTQAGNQAMQQAANISLQSGNIMLAVLALCNLGESYRKVGHLHKSQALYQQALALATDPAGDRLPVAGRALIGLGDLAREWNDLMTAEELLKEGIALTEKSGQVGAFMGYLSLARLKQGQGDWAAAQEVVRLARQLALAFDATQLDDLIVAMNQAGLAILQGDTATAMRWVEERGLLIEMDIHHGNATEDYIQAHLRKYEQVILARLWLAQDRPHQALNLLDSVLPQFEILNRIGMIIEIYILKSFAFHALGDHLQTFSALERALSLAEPEGYTRIFLDEGDALAALLRRLNDRDSLVKAYVNKLLVAFGQKLPTAASTPSSALVTESLSERELDVLRLLNSGLSSVEIADELVVSVNTIRSHIKSIYGKLDVHSRYQAVAKAKATHLI